jgi:hypothetical protein
VSLGLPPFRSALPFRLRRAAGPPSRGPQRPSPLARGLVPRPLRLAARTGLRTTRLIPGSASPSLASGSTSALRFIPVVRPPPTAHLSGSPRPSSTNQRQRGETPPPVSAPGKPGARLPSPTRPAATSPAPARARRATCASEARLCRPHAPVGFDARRAQRGSERRAVRSPSSLTPQCERAPPPRMPFVRPGTRCARPGAGDGGRGEREGDGTAQAPPSACVMSTSLVGSSLRPSTSRVAGFSVTAAACCGRTIRRYAKRALFRASSRHSVGPEHSLRCAPSHYISRDCAIRIRGSLRALLISGARSNVTGGKPPPQWKF